MSSPTPKTSGGGKKWIFWGCGGCLGLVIIIGIAIGIFGVAGFKKLMGMAQDTPVYKEALERVQKSPEVEAELGSPVTAAGIAVPTNMSNNNGNKQAAVTFTVHGPNSDAAVTADGTYTGEGPVTFSVLQVVATKSGKTINLLGAAPPEPVPPAPPGGGVK